MMNQTNSIIPQSDDRLFSYFIKEALLGMMGPDSRTTDGGRRDERQFWILLGLLLIVGTEPFKILLRKNIGKLSLSLSRLIAASFIYLLWAALLLFLPLADDFSVSNWAIYFQVGGMFYIFFAILLMAKGFRMYIKSKREYLMDSKNIEKHLHRGDSLLFRHLPANKAWLREPQICFVISLFLLIAPAFISPALMLITAPLLTTSISFWFNEWFQVNNVWEVVTKKVNQQKQWQQNKERSNNGEEEEFASAN